MHAVAVVGFATKAPPFLPGSQRSPSPDMAMHVLRTQAREVHVSACPPTCRDSGLRYRRGRVAMVAAKRRCQPDPLLLY